MLELKIVLLSILFFVYISVLGWIFFLLYKLSKDFYCILLIIIGIMSFLFLFSVNENGQILSLAIFILTGIYVLHPLSKWIVNNYGENIR